MGAIHLGGHGSRAGRVRIGRHSLSSANSRIGSPREEQCFPELAMMTSKAVGVAPHEEWAFGHVVISDIC